MTNDDKQITVDHSETLDLVKGFTDDRLIKQDKEARGKILALQSVMEDMPSTLDQFKLTHHFAPSVYAREMLLPAGHTIVGKIHKHSHLNIIVKGRVSVSTEEGAKEFKGGEVFTSFAGTKRAVYAHEDTTWITIHVTEQTDLDKIEDEIIAKDFEEIDMIGEDK
jgi:quercetin dioxygenase-like cupin family protein